MAEKREGKERNTGDKAQKQHPDLSFQPGETPRGPPAGHRLKESSNLLPLLQEG